jgi:hypothetical protein
MGFLAPRGVCCGVVWDRGGLSARISAPGGLEIRHDGPLLSMGGTRCSRCASLNELLLVREKEKESPYLASISSASLPVGPTIDGKS